MKPEILKIGAFVLLLNIAPYIRAQITSNPSEIISSDTSNKSFRANASMHVHEHVTILGEKNAVADSTKTSRQDVTQVAAGDTAAAAANTTPNISAGSDNSAADNSAFAAHNNDQSHRPIMYAGLIVFGLAILIGFYLLTIMSRRKQ
jgi:hypothetical protein